MAGTSLGRGSLARGIQILSLLLCRWANARLFCVREVLRNTDGESLGIRGLHCFEIPNRKDLVCFVLFL